MRDVVALQSCVAAVQVDVGQRGKTQESLASVYEATQADFLGAALSIARHPSPQLLVVTGFFIPTGQPPAYETDGPLGALFLARVSRMLRIRCVIASELAVVRAVQAGQQRSGLPQIDVAELPCDDEMEIWSQWCHRWQLRPTHIVFLERPGPNCHGRCLSMRGQDITSWMRPAHRLIEAWSENGVASGRPVTIGIGDGGNEIGMGKLPAPLVAVSIPMGDRIHCRVATDYLLVAGVSNWGAYALGAALLVLRGEQRLGVDLFEAQHERTILEAMVRTGPLVDGVTGQLEATVDGLSWIEYARPLHLMREVLSQW